MEKKILNSKKKFNWDNDRDKNLESPYAWDKIT